MIAEPSKVLFEHIVAASHRIRGHVRLTPCDRSERLSKLVGAECFIKLENMQHTGAYKERGALNKLKSLSLAEAQKGVVAASAGNHGQAVAYHAGLMGIQASIYMPVGTATIRVSRTEDYGANVHLTGNSYEEAYKACLEHLNDGVLIHSYDDTRVIAGHGTIGLEILQQAPNIDVIVVPIGGGGLISGIALAAKEINPRVRIIGVEPHGIPSMYLTTSTGIRDIYPSVITIADCINVSLLCCISVNELVTIYQQVRQVGELTSRMCTQLVDDYVTVTDEEICRAMVFLLEGEKTVTEGAGAACVAALLTNKVRTSVTTATTTDCYCNTRISKSSMVYCRLLISVYSTYLFLGWTSNVVYIVM